MIIFKYLDYRKWLLKWISNQKNKGRGQNLAIARHLDLSTTMISHILNGTNDLTVEQGIKLADYCFLQPLEKDYFIELIHYARAKNIETKSYYKKKIDALVAEAGILKNRLKSEYELTTADQAVFYSDWVYPAVHLCTAIEGLNTPDVIAQFLGIDRRRADTVIQFLLEKQFLINNGNKLQLGLNSTSITNNDVFIKSHHKAWRLKSIMDISQNARIENFNYSTVVCLSEGDYLKVRELLIAFLQNFQSIYPPSPSEKIAYLNIDWIKMGSNQEKSS